MILLKFETAFLAQMTIEFDPSNIPHQQIGLVE